MLAALPWPDEATPLKLCAPHLRISRILQCRGWNADPAHQIVAGQARARQLTREHQSAAGRAAFAAFSARWRASQGLPPLSAEDARRYVTPAMIRDLGRPVPETLQMRIYEAWCAGLLRGVIWWLAQPVETAFVLHAEQHAGRAGYAQLALVNDAGNDAGDAVEGEEHAHD